MPLSPEELAFLSQSTSRDSMTTAELEVVNEWIEKQERLIEKQERLEK